MNTRTNVSADGRQSLAAGAQGLTLVEVMLATVMTAVGLTGGYGMLQWAEHGRHFGAKGTRALALATSKLEVKRAVPWDHLLLDVNGGAAVSGERAMVDDGNAPDLAAGDGIYTGSDESEGIQVVWTIQPSQPGSLHNSGHATIQVVATYRTLGGATRKVTVGTIRSNPRFVGPS